MPRSSEESFKRSSHNPGAPEIVEPVEHLAAQNALDLGDDGAGRFEGFGGRDGDLAHRRLQRQADAEIEHQPEPQLARRLSSAFQWMSLGGRLVPSRRSGFDSTLIISAASSTVRVIGPATRPK